MDMVAKGITAHSIMVGIVMGVCATVAGWLKNSQPGKFEWRGLILKLPVGIVVGIAAATQGIGFDSAMEWASGIGVVSLVDQFVKAVVRRFFPGWLGVSEGEKKARALSR